MEIGTIMPEAEQNSSRRQRWTDRFDNLLTLMVRRQYTGSNDAIAAVHTPLRYALLTIAAFTIIGITFGALVPIESAAIASGNVVVLSNTKTVQHLEGGIVKKLLVKEGEVVTRGQPLVELSDIQPQASLSILNSELFAARAVQARITALQDGKKTMQLSEEMQTRAEKDPELAKAIAAQTHLFTTQSETHRSKIQTLHKRISQLKEEITGLRAQVKSAAGQLGLVGEEVTSVQKLYNKGYATKPRLLALKREQEQLAGNRGEYLASIAKANQSIAEMELQILNLNNEFATSLAEELHEVQQHIADLSEKQTAASDVVSRTIITAPTEGIVTGLKHHTVGGVIQAGEPIMNIVPQGEALMLEAHVKPSDIDVVTPGLPAKIVFSAFKARNLPRLNGEVTRVSADAFTDSEGGLQTSYYLARIQVDADELAQLGNTVRLTPGMPVDIFIRTGSRSFLGYLFAPITDSMYRAFREE